MRKVDVPMNQKVIFAVVLAVLTSVSFAACTSGASDKESSVVSEISVESTEPEPSEETSEEVSVNIPTSSHSSYAPIPTEIELESHEEGYTTPLSDLEYYFLDGSKAVITKYTGTSSYLSVPATIENLPVEIAEGAFEGAEIRTLILPDTLTEIPDKMCLDCKYLQNIQVPVGLVNIGEEAFKNTPALTSFNFPETLENIEYAAFWESGISGEITVPAKWKLGISIFVSCHITKVVFEDGVTEIPDALFDNNEVLSEVYIPETVTEIGTAAFCRTSIKEITVPKSVKKIGNDFITDVELGLHKKNYTGTIRCYYNSEAYFYAENNYCKVDVIDGIPS